MGRDYEERPCPECGSKNVEQNPQYHPDEKPYFRTVGKCFHCHHEWVIQPK